MIQNDKYVVSGSEDGKVYFWETLSSNPTHPLTSVPIFEDIRNQSQPPQILSSSSTKIPHPRINTATSKIHENASADASSREKSPSLRKSTPTFETQSQTEEGNQSEGEDIDMRLMKKILEKRKILEQKQAHQHNPGREFKKQRTITNHKRQFFSHLNDEIEELEDDTEDNSISTVPHANQLPKSQNLSVKLRDTYPFEIQQRPISESPSHSLSTLPTKKQFATVSCLDVFSSDDASRVANLTASYRSTASNYFKYAVQSTYLAAGTHNGFIAILTTPQTSSSQQERG